MKHDFAVVFVVLNCSRTSHGGCRCKFATTTGWIRTCSTHVVGEPQIIEPLAEWRSLKWLPKKNRIKIGDLDDQYDSAKDVREKKNLS